MDFRRSLSRFAFLTILTFTPVGYSWEVRASALTDHRQKVTGSETIPASSSRISYAGEVNQVQLRGQLPLIPHVWSDLKYLMFQRDFYYTVGGLSLAPEVFSRAIRNEDPELTEWWAKSQFAGRFFELGNGMGSPIYPVAASIASIAWGKLNHSYRLQSFGSDLFRAQVANGLLTGLMKVSINRTRPNGGAYSYPSGHTSTAFTSAAVIYRDLGPRWGIPAFVAASYVGLSRMQANKHYLSDVAAGAILGTYVGLKLTGHHDRERKLSLMPSYGSRGPGMTLSVKF